MSRCFRDSCVHHIYSIKGPSGIYIGNTVNPASRWKAHRSLARRGAYHARPIHTAMIRDGVDLYDFSVVARAAGCERAAELERALILQLRAEGHRVLNVMPRAPSKLINSEVHAL